MRPLRVAAKYPIGVAQFIVPGVVSLRAQVRHEMTFLADSTLTQEAYENRLLLRNVMTSAGYKVLLSEWWHFNFKTRDEAKANYKVIP